MSNTQIDAKTGASIDSEHMNQLLEKVQNFTRYLIQDRYHPLDISYVMAYVSAHMGLYMEKDEREVMRQVLWGLMDGTRPTEKALHISSSTNNPEGAEETH